MGPVHYSIGCRLVLARYTHFTMHSSAHVGKLCELCRTSNCSQTFSIVLLCNMHVLVIIEMGRSSAHAEVRPNSSAECSARFGSATWDYSAEVWQTFGVIGASKNPKLCKCTKNCPWRNGLLVSLMNNINFLIRPTFVCRWYAVVFLHSFLPSQTMRACSRAY